MMNTIFMSDCCCMHNHPRLHSIHHLPSVLNGHLMGDSVGQLVVVDESFHHRDGSQLSNPTTALAGPTTSFLSRPLVESLLYMPFPLLTTKHSFSRLT